MHTRELGKTGVRLSEVALGTWGLSGAYGGVSESVAKSTVEAAREAGVTTFDAAPLWGEGKAEALLGEALEGQRDEVQLVTRAGAVWEDDRVRHRFEPDALRADLEASLERLKTDHLDVWLLHEPPEDALLKDELFALCEELKEAETIRAWGVSTAGVDEARLALSKGADALCMPYNLLTADDLQDLEHEIQHAGAGVLARSPLFHGLLSGRWTEYRQFAEDDHRRARWTSKALTIRVRQVNRLRFLVHDDVRSLSTAALRFVLASPVVTSCLLGARRPVQISAAKDLAGEPPYLPDEDLARLPQVLAEAGA
ncbi:MAG TPA: aldo/keto reductase [Polyangiaceae bacterium LLY-WYZ-15_(1-7)]|nr:aldo/keto reductase [Polyangiaceae bacterium LLY-WYZ-15_(1-7)]HJL04476.1 aldo/keto reductase [Polyangiaceae bacterium LLY-WYZ-15_(1-7)]HJL08428.1 aldo/keto reductase [Polyangiaceae bacterium LLY-WYZ-15_(1-7)]HJL23814.1 aldo/keto reductase [Polyangiaceae bacterium LLY-WYZ-15_(1-7)]HJL29115.1 aldo/keto reductase [Polyangiaceae bacterium LLY-WYZ-15_(1-7)]